MTNTTSGRTNVGTILKDSTGIRSFSVIWLGSPAAHSNLLNVREPLSKNNYPENPKIKFEQNA